jgi:hypothetical protein
MGVDYTAVLMVGKQFDNEDEAREFLLKHGVELPDEDSQEMEDGLGEYLNSEDFHGLEWERLDYYTSWDGGVLGWTPSVRQIDTFADEVRQMRERWAGLFGGAAPDLVHTVKVH